MTEAFFNTFSYSCPKVDCKNSFADVNQLDTHCFAMHGARLLEKHRSDLRTCNEDRNSALFEKGAVNCQSIASTSTMDRSLDRSFDSSSQVSTLPTPARSHLL